MPRPAKQPRPQNNSDSDSNGEDEDIEMDQQEIQVDFEGRTPQDTDIGGIKILLQQLLLKAHINLTELSNVIIENNHIGSVVKQCEDDYDDNEDDADSLNSVFGITTVISLDQKQNHQCIHQLREYLIDVSVKNSKDKTQMLIKQALESNSALLLNERFVNIPPQISSATFESLQEEIRQAIGKGNLNKLNYYIMICKLHKLDGKNKKSKSDIDNIVWSNSEEEVISTEAIDFFDYSVETESDTAISGDWSEDDKDMCPYRRVLIIEANKLSHIVNLVKNFVS